MVASKKLAFKSGVKAMSGGNLMDTFTVTQIDSGKVMSVVVMAIVLVVILAIVLYIIYLIKTQNFSRTVVYNNAFLIVDGGKNGGNVKLPQSTTNTVTYTFWVYLNNFVPQGAQNEPGLVWMGFASKKSSSVAASPASVTQTTPIVFMDAATNRMYASFNIDSTTASSALTSPIVLSGLRPARTNLTGDMRTTATPMNYMTIPIDYVPLQRWVHYAFVINQSTISIYQDASVYSVRSASDLEANDLTSRPLFNTVSPTEIMTKANSDASKGPVLGPGSQQQSMYMSSFCFYNYALNQKDIQTIYNRGPNTVNGWLGWLNIGNYKFQSPIVKVSDANADNSHSVT